MINERDYLSKFSFTYLTEKHKLGNLSYGHGHIWTESLFNQMQINFRRRHVLPGFGFPVLY